MTKRRIGEEVRPTKDLLEKERKQFVIGTDYSYGSIFKVFMKTIGFVFVLLFFIIAIFLIVMIISFDSSTSEDLLFVLFLIIILLIPVIPALSLIMLNMVKCAKNSKIIVDREMIKIHHQSMVNHPIVLNFIKISDIERIERAGKKYLKERKRATPWYNWFMFIPTPPPGGMYSYYGDPEGLLILHMKEPVAITNYSFLMGKKRKKGFMESLFPDVMKRYYVKEIIINADRKKQRALSKRLKISVGKGVLQTENL